MKVKLIQVLETIREHNDGVLMPGDVVEAARPDDSPLHTRFEWDDGKASKNYRLWQARQLISLMVTEMSSEKKSYDVRTYISLTTDRIEGGYRLITNILENQGMRRQMVVDALSELRTFRVKYGKLNELAKVFAAMEEVEEEVQGS